MTTEVLKLIDAKWADEFRRFVDTGDASDEFFAYLDSNPACQQAIDMVLRKKSEGLERVSQLLRSEEAPGRTATVPTLDQKSATLARALGLAARLSDQDRLQVIRNAVAAVQTTMQDQRPVEELASELAQEVGVIVR